MSTSTQKSTIITLRLSLELYGQCKTIADKEEIPLSYVIRRAIKKGLNAESKPVIKTTEPTLPEDWE